LSLCGVESPPLLADTHAATSYYSMAILT
jgi:hypothetical protein